MIPGSNALQVRLAAAAVSVAVTAAVLLLFTSVRPWRVAPPAAWPEGRAVLFTLLSPSLSPRLAAPSPSPARAAIPPEGRGAVPPSEQATAIGTTEAAALTPRVPDGLPAAAAAGPAIDAPAAAASAPLRLDRAVLREAARASRSAVGRMADASGTPLGDSVVGRDERLAGDVARSVRRECLPLSNPGGDLLMTPLMALAGKITGRCD